MKSFALFVASAFTRRRPDRPIYRVVSEPASSEGTTPNREAVLRAIDAGILRPDVLEENRGPDWRPMDGYEFRSMRRKAERDYKRSRR